MFLSDPDFDYNFDEIISNLISLSALGLPVGIALLVLISIFQNTFENNEFYQKYFITKYKTNTIIGVSKIIDTSYDDIDSFNCSSTITIDTDFQYICIDTNWVTIDTIIENNKEYEKGDSIYNQKDKIDILYYLSYFIMSLIIITYPIMALIKFILQMIRKILFKITDNYNYYD